MGDGRGVPAPALCQDARALASALRGQPGQDRGAVRRALLPHVGVLSRQRRDDVPDTGSQLVFQMQLSRKRDAVPIVRDYITDSAAALSGSRGGAGRASGRSLNDVRAQPDEPPGSRELGHHAPIRHPGAAWERSEQAGTGRDPVTGAGLLPNRMMGRIDSCRGYASRESDGPVLACRCDGSRPGSRSCPVGHSRRPDDD